MILPTGEKNPPCSPASVFSCGSRATLRVVEKLDDTKTVVSSSLHSLNIEFGAARVAALPRAAWSSGCSWPSVLGATLSAAHAANLKPYRASWGERAGAFEARSGKPRELSRPSGSLRGLGAIALEEGGFPNRLKCKTYNSGLLDRYAPFRMELCGTYASINSMPR